MLQTIAVIVLLAAASQEDADLGPLISSDAHEFAFRPPAGWTASPGEPPNVVRYATPEGVPAGELLLIHYSPPNPTPLKHFQEQLEPYLKEKYPGHTSLLHREVTLDGHAALQLALKTQGKDSEEVVIYRTILHRSHLEYYIFDCKSVSGGWDRWRVVFDKSIATFRIRPTPLTFEERGANARTVEALKGGILGKDWLVGEAWQGVFMTNQKVGYQRQKLTPMKIDGAAGYAIESDTFLDFKEGGKTQTQVRGAFTADGKVQKLESEHVVYPPKGEELKFRFQATLQNGRVSVRRQIREYQEETGFSVPEGTLFTEVADVFRRAVAPGAKTTYFVPTLNLFLEETREESIEVAGLDTADLGEKGKRQVQVVLALTNRSKSLVYWYEIGGALLVVQAGKHLFGILALTKEEALKP